MLICPICGEALSKQNNRLVCHLNHSFDFAKEGYINLLCSNKKGDFIGDNRDMAKSRNSFLEKGYYDSLVCELKKEYEKLKNVDGIGLDICCGEGYYTQQIARTYDREFYGFDISKEMVRLAAKRKSQVQFFVANMTAIPVKSQCVAAAFHLFAPFCEKEFARILAPNGRLISVSPGKRHLYELKELLYDKPYENEEKLPAYTQLVHKERRRTKSVVGLQSNEDIYALFKMTPYYYHTNKKHKEKLDNVQELKVTLDFIIDIFEKTEDVNGKAV